MVETLLPTSRSARWGLAFALAYLPAMVAFLLMPAEPIHDAASYWELGTSMAESGIFGTADRPEGYAAPGYAAFVAGVVLLFGQSVTAVMAANLVVFAGTLLLTAYIGMRLYNESVGLLGMILVGWVWDLLVLPSQLLSENPFIFLLLLGVALMIDQTPTSRWWRFLLAGLVFGVAALVRGTIIALIPFLMIGLLFWLAWDWRRRLRMESYLFLCLLGFMLPVSAWTYRNYQQFGFVFPISMSSGDNLALGNNRFGTFWYVAPDHPIRREIGLDPNDPVATYNNGREEFLRELREQPLRSLLRCFPRLWHWGLAQWPWFANPALQFAEDPNAAPNDILIVEGLISWQWMLYVLATLGGLFFARHTDRSDRLLVLGICAYWFFFHAMMVIHPRYRLPVVPFFCIYSAIFLIYVIPRLGCMRADVMRRMEP